MADVFDLDLREVGREVPPAKIAAFLDSHFEAVGPALRAIDDWHTKSRIAAQTDLACSGGPCEH